MIMLSCYIAQLPACRRYLRYRTVGTVGRYRRYHATYLRYGTYGNLNIMLFLNAILLFRILNVTVLRRSQVQVQVGAYTLRV